MKYKDEVLCFLASVSCTGHIHIIFMDKLPKMSNHPHFCDLVLIIDIPIDQILLYIVLSKMCESGQWIHAAGNPGIVPSPSLYLNPRIEQAIH